MVYYAQKYSIGGGTGIIAYDDNGEPDAVLTVNLVDYGILPEDEYTIYVPLYKLPADYVDEFIEYFGAKVVRSIKIGYNNSAEVLEVRLPADWKSKCIEVA